MDTTTKAALGVLIGGGIAFAIAERAKSHNTLEGRQKVLDAIKKRPDIPGFGEAGGAPGTPTVNQGLGIILGPRPQGTGWATKEVDAKGITMPQKIVVGAGAGRRLVPFAGDLSSWIEKVSGATMASLVDSVTRLSPPAGTNTESLRQADLLVLQNSTTVVGFPDLAHWLSAAGYGSASGAMLFPGQSGAPARMTFIARVSGRQKSINTVSWVEAATHAAVAALIDEMLPGPGGQDFKNREALMEEIFQKSSTVNGFTQLHDLLQKQGFLTDPLQMKDLPSTPIIVLQLGKLPPQAAQALINKSTTYTSIRAVVTAAEKSEPAPPGPPTPANKEKQEAMAALLKLQSKHAGHWKGTNPLGDLAELVSALMDYDWAGTPNPAALPKISNKPISVRLYQQIEILPDLRTWVTNATAVTVNQLVNDLTDKGTDSFQRFLLYQMLQAEDMKTLTVRSPNIWINDVGKLVDWMVQQSWLRKTPDLWQAVAARSSDPNVKADAVVSWDLLIPFPVPNRDTGLRKFHMSWAWNQLQTSAPPVSGHLTSLILGPTMAGGAVVGSGRAGWITVSDGVKTVWERTKSQIENF